jgi:hypothetical protein
MSISGRVAAIAVGCALLVPSLAAADVYTLANFSGGIFGGGANVKSPFSGAGFFPGQTFGGSFVYDNNKLPGSTGAFVNVPYSSFPDIAQIPASTAFQLNFGPLVFDLSDAAFPAAIQYSPTGKFNGFSYVSDFAFLGGDYELQISGGTLSIVQVTNGVPGFQSLVNGYVNIGDAAVTGKTTYTPPPIDNGNPGEGGAVPEPASWALLIAGFGGIGAVMRRKRARSTFA